MGGFVRIITAVGKSLGSAFTMIISKTKTWGASLKSAKSQLGSLVESFKGIRDINFDLPSLGKIVDAMLMIKDLAASVVMPGFNYVEDIERNKQGIAGILQSMTLLNGETLSFGQAMQVSDDIIKKLEKDALATSATTEELAGAFKNLLAPGLNAGLNLDEIEKLTTSGINAGKSLGLDSNKATEELRSMLEGNAQGSKLAEIMGITSEDIEQAKQSSMGLFTFLQEHLAVFDEVSANYPETLEGKISKLEEVGKIASSKFTEAFEPEIKECLDFVTDMIGEVNTQTGELEINPLILEFIKDLKLGWQELTSFIDDAIPSNGQLINNLTDTVGALYYSVCNVASAFLDFIRILANSVVIQMCSSIICEIAKAVEWLTEKISKFLDVVARLSGIKHTNTSNFAKSVQGAMSGSISGVGNIIKNAPNLIESNSGSVVTHPAITEKQNNMQQQREAEAAKRAAEQAERERIQASQKHMQEMLKYWKECLNDIQKKYNANQDALKFRFEQGSISSDEYYQNKLQQDIDLATDKIKNLDNQIAEVKTAEFPNESDRNNKLHGLEAEKEIIDSYKKELISGQNEMKQSLELLKSGNLSSGKEFQSRRAYEAIIAYKKEREPAEVILRKYNEMNGDISSDKLKDLDEQYAKIKDILSKIKDDEVVKQALNKVDMVYFNEKSKIKFNQIQKNLETANTDFIEAEQEILNGVIDGTKSVGEATEESAMLYNKMFGSSIDELENMLKNSQISEGTRQIIENQIKKIKQTGNQGLDNILKSIDEKLQQEINQINANPNLTKMQKEMAINAVTRKANLEKVSGIQEKIGELKGKPASKENLDEIERLEKQKEMIKKLTEIPALFDQINQAGRQALENGLFEFFSSGINQCKSLSEAFQNLGKSILQSIQQVLADQLTRQFMSMLMPKFAGGGDVGDSIQNNAKGGKIIGPGTGTSDSVLSWLSNGEYVIKADSVKKFGTTFLDHINRGMVPPEIFPMKANYALNSFVGEGASTYATTNSVNVPVNITGFSNSKMASELRNNIEDTVVKIIRKYS